MKRIRLEFSKSDAVRFVGHLDTMKTFERAIRRAGLPIAFSEGFNPHPKISFGSALAVGVTSDGEYVDIEFKERLEPNRIQELLNDNLPPGFRITGSKEVAKEAPALMAVLNRSNYTVNVKLSAPRSQEELDQSLIDFLQKDEILFAKWSKKGPKEVDLRPGILSLSGTVKELTAVLKMKVFSGSEMNVRPEEVVAAIVKYSNLPFEVQGIQIQRERVYIQKDTEILSPME